MSSQNVTDYLYSRQVSFSKRHHPPAFSAQEVAEKAHISGRRVAKTVVVKLDGKLALCVLPATERVNFSLLRQAAGSHTAELAREEEFIDAFPSCEPGLMPPFGGLYGLPVYVSDSLKQDIPLAFSSGQASELLELSWQDFDRLVHPVFMTEKQKTAIG